MNLSVRMHSIYDLEQSLSRARLRLFSLSEREYEYQIKKESLEFEIQTLENEVASKKAGGFIESSGVVDQQRNTNAPVLPNAYKRARLPLHSSQHRPDSSEGAFLPPPGFAAYSASGQNGLNGHFASDSMLTNRDYTTDMPGSWNFDLADTTAHLPGSPLPPAENASTSGSSPDSNSALPRKRQKQRLSIEKSSLGRRSVRASPSPARTENTTPTSYESYDIPEDMFAFLGGNPKESLEEMRAEQREQERLAEERKRIMLRDEELAREIFQEESNTVWPGSQQNLVNPHISAGRSSQSVLDARGRYLRPSPLSSPPVTPNASRLSLPSASTKQGPADRSGVRVKQEDNFQPTPASFLPRERMQTPSPHPSVKFGSSGQRAARNSISETGSTSRAATVKQELDQPRSDFINLVSDSDSGSSSPVQWNMDNFIDLEADDWQTASYSGNVEQSAADPSTSYAFSSAIINATSDLTNRIPHFGQTLHSSGSNLLSAPQDQFDFGGDPVYGSLNSAGNAPFIDLSSDVTYDLFNQTGYLPQAIDSMTPQMYQKYQERVEYLSNDPTRTKAEIQSLLENIRPDEDLPPQNREGTPEAMTYALMEHQKLGLTWLKKMEESGQKGGILADDMGLGKTIQALALMVSRRSDNPLCKTTLIVAPVALMRQWEKEIETKLKPNREHRLKTFILHGSNRQKSWEFLRTYDVVLTTFGTLSSELKRKEGIDMKRRANPNWQPTSKEDILPTLGDDCFWYRVIIDEAQCIKNKSTKAALAASFLQAKFRFCMTGGWSLGARRDDEADNIAGTPMMNSIDELYSLIRFLRIVPWSDSKEFSANFSRPLKGQSSTAKAQAMEKLQVLLRAILLRRTKKSMIDGEPILKLPPRNTESRHAVFSEDESQFYQALQTQTQLQFNKYLRANNIGRNYSNILVLLLRLRQACCHPHLIKNFGQEGFNGDVSAEDMVKLAKELAPDAVARIKELSDNNDDSALECPICMDMTENATIFIPCGHNTCSECFARISDPSQAIANGDATETRNGEGKCPNCRGKISAKKIIDHNTFKKVHQPQSILGDLEDEEADVEITDDSSSETDDDSDDEIDTKGNLKGFIVDDDEEGDQETTDDEEEPGYRPGQTPFEKACRKKAKKSKGKGKARADKPPRRTLAQLKKESMRNAKAKRRYLKRLEREWETSAKIEKTMEIIRDVQNSKNEETKQPEKIIIFSQFTSLLDLLEVPISRERLGYTRYDGSMKSDARNDAVVDFTENKATRIMLISLKAGNSGLNLTAASQVIIFDPFWNPYIEEQAIDRAHRIGQRVPVHVHRILVPETVEDRILALQEKKRALIESALDEGAAQRIGRLGTRDLAFLFVSSFIMMDFRVRTNSIRTYLLAHEQPFPAVRLKPRYTLESAFTALVHRLRSCLIIGSTALWRIFIPIWLLSQHQMHFHGQLQRWGVFECNFSMELFRYTRYQVLLSK